MARSSAGQSLGIFALVALSGCAPAAPAATVVLSDADRSAIQASIDDYAAQMRAANYAGVAAHYTEGAVVMPPNAPQATGHAEIQQALATFPPITQLEFSVASMEGSGDLAYVHGTYSMTMTLPDGTSAMDSGKYLEVRRRQADGRWLISHDIFNSNVPLPGSPAPATGATP